jgi:rSAM/selenodomain-associated transferase 1
MNGTVAIGIMCKAPAAGASKTRLSPPLSSDEAATLSRCFIADLASIVAGLPPELGVRGFAVFTPPEAEPALAGVLPAGFGTLPQRGESLAERCTHAVADLLAESCDAACLLNADSPTLPTAVLEAAVEALRRPGDRVVLGPAIDGGYYLIGTKRAAPELFRDIAWSTSGVLAQTEARARELGLDVERLPAWYDVDDGLGLIWLLQELLGDGTAPVANGLRGSSAARTRSYLSALSARGDGPPRVMAIASADEPMNR